MAMECDVVIAGGGLVGASLAAALADSGVQVVVVEAVPLTSDEQPSYDERMVALTWSSRRIFDGIGVWSSIASADASPIHSIHVSDRGHFGMARLSVEDLRGDGRADALGYLVATRVIGRALAERMQASDNITLLCPATVRRVNCQADFVEVDAEQAKIKARLLVIADGGRSQLAQSVGMKSRGRNYSQQALVSVVSADRPHQQRAYERFTGSGPLALLPASDNRYALAWTLEPDEAERIMAMSDSAFLTQLQNAFGHRAGRFVSAGNRRLYPLSLATLHSPIGARTVAVGNAAHTVHPVAGQGFNLGLRDIAQLADAIFRASVDGDDIGHRQLLHRYAQSRRADTRNVARLTDGLIRGFRSQLLPLAALRSGGLSIINLAPPLRRRLLNLTMGLNVDAGPLSLGLPLCDAGIRDSGP